MNPVRSVLAFDFGSKNIGVAACSLAAAQLAGVSSELSPLRAKDGIPDWQEIQSLIESVQADLILVGLPRASDGSDMEITRRARKFGNRLKGMFQREVVFVDETLSTKEAKHEAQARGLGRHYASNPVDSIAARLILETWLNESKSVVQER